MKKRLIFFVILSSVIGNNNLFAQCGNLPPQINFTNGSFEDVPKSPSAPSGWQTLMNSDGSYNITPDVQPILNPVKPDGTEHECSIKNPANHGNTYVSLMRCPGGPQEYISQQLTTPLQKGITYKSSIDLMGPKQYKLKYTPLRDNTVCIGIEIWGGFTMEGKSQLLYSSAGVPNNDIWSTTDFTITPNDNYTFFSIYANAAPGCNSDNSCAFLGMDNLTDLKPSAIETKATAITCNNAKDGIAEVTKPTGTSFIYDWKQVTGGTYTGQGQVINNLGPGKYAVIVKSGSTVIGCDTVEIKEPAAIVLTPDQTNVKCFGDNNGTAKVTASGGTPGYTYAWAPNTSDKTASVAGLTAGTYTCTVTDATNCTKQQVITITEPVKLTATATGTNVTVPKGTDGTVTATPAGGTAPFTYLWSTTPTAQTTQTATNLKAGSYTCVVTDKNNCTAQVTVTITQPAVIKIKVDTLHVTCFNGSNGKIVLTITEGTAPFTYVWSTPNGVNDIAGNLTAGTYSCVVTDADGASDAVTVIIKQPALLTVSATVKNNGCNAATAGEATAIAQGGTAPYQYSWNTQPVQNTAAISNLAAGSYTCTVTDKNNCTASTVVSITQPAPITATLDSVPVSCNGLSDGKATIHARGGTKPFQYALANMVFQTDSTFKNLAAGNYTCTIKDANGCSITRNFTLTEPGPVTITSQSSNVTCNGAADGSATVTVTGAASVNYSWLPNTATTATVNKLTAGTYTCTITYNGSCKADPILFTITEPKPVGLIPIPEQTICLGQSTTLIAIAFDGNAGSYTYDWNKGTHTGASYTVTPNLTATYTVIATDSKGCKSLPGTATIKVAGPLVIEKLAPATICEGESTTLTANVTGGSGTPYTYSWSPQVTGTGETVTVKPTSTQTYTLTVKDNCGTPPAKDSVVVTVIATPIVDFVADTVAGCAPLCVKFTANIKIQGDAISQWNWDFGDKLGVHKSTAIHTNCFNEPGKYNVSLNVKSLRGCAATFIKNSYININPVPTAAFTYGPADPTISEPLVNFTDISAANIKSWSWNFGDKDPTGNTSTTKNAHHHYSDTGNYCVTLVVQTINNCENKTVQCLRIAPDMKIYIPNAFTPNSDSKNPEFYPVGEYIKNYEMWIYDRWGMMLFHSNNMNDHWNGRFNNTGEPVPIDVYVYRIQVFDTEDKRHEYTGTVSVIR